MDDLVRLRVVFFKTDADTEPVRDWLKNLVRRDRKVIGEDIKTVQFGWPLGLPLIRKLEEDLWEVRSRLKQRISRVIFTVDSDLMILLHAFIKKSQKTPTPDLNTARKRLAQYKDQSS